MKFQESRIKNKEKTMNELDLQGQAVDDIFEQAIANSVKQQQEAAEKKNNNQNNTGFAPIHYATLDYNKYAQVRLLGLPPGETIAFNDPTSGKIVNYSRIKSDDGSIFSCKWPEKGTVFTDSRGKSLIGAQWIMWRVYDKVMAYTWKDKKRVYVNEFVHPDLYNRVNKNGKAVNSKNYSYEKGMTPKTYIVMNCIDRSQMDWHKENKHTAILSSKVNIVNKETENGVEKVFYYDIGIPYTTYHQKVWQEIAQAYAGNFNKYDLVMTKVHYVEKGKDVYDYVVFHAEVDVKKFEKTFKDFKPEFATAALSDEELSWERYDLQKMYRPTSYTKLSSNLGVFFQQVDAEMGTTFYQELMALVEEEKAYLKANVSEDTPSFSPSDFEDKDPTEEDDVVVNTRKPVEKPESVVELTQEIKDKLEARGFKGLDLLTNIEKSFIVGINPDAENEDDIFTWKKGVLPSRCGGADCNFVSPMEFHACLKCGSIFE